MTAPKIKVVRKRKTKAADQASTWIQSTIISHAVDMAAAVRPLMRLEQETFVVAYLNVRNVMIGEPYVAAIGTVNGVEVTPRDVFREAVRRNACGVVLSHNHPSGSIIPSAEDIELTKRMKAVGDIVGIPVIDHVVITTQSFTSIAEWLGGM